MLTSRMITLIVCDTTYYKLNAVCDSIIKKINIEPTAYMLLSSWQ